MKQGSPSCLSCSDLPNSFSQMKVGTRPSMINLDQSTPSPIERRLPIRPSIKVDRPQLNIPPPTQRIQSLKPDTRHFIKKAPITIADLTNLSLKISSHLPALEKVITAEPNLPSSVGKARSSTQSPSILVSSATGTGKSLGIPWYLSRTGKRVLISVPTVAASNSLAAKQRELNREIEIGQAAEGKINYTERSQVIYATSGHIRRRFLDFYRQFNRPSGSQDDFVTKLISQIDVLILDEIHLGSIDDHVNYSLWKYGYEHGYSVPKLILSSATPDDITYTASIRYHIPTKSYPVRVNYHERNYRLADRQLIPDLIDTIFAFHRSELKGDFLVFVAGKSEINQIISKLSPIVATSEKKAILLPAHGDLSSQDFREIYRQPSISRETGQPLEDAPRKIIIATNIAETSITVEGVSLVIDSMQEKRSETSATGGFRLALHHISKSSAIQRQGRTGRTGPGIVYRMCTEEFFINLENSRPEEIFRVPIYNTVMELMEVGLDPSEILIDIDQSSITQAIKLLIQLNLLTESGDVTEAGHFVTHFPLNIRNATILWLWIQEKLPLYAGVVIISLLDSYGPPYFWYPSQTLGQTNHEYNQMILNHKDDYFYQFIGYSDVHTIMNIWNVMTDYFGGPVRNPRKITGWTKQNSINNRKLQEAIRIIKQVTNALTRLGYQVKTGKLTTDGVVNALRPLAEKVYQDLIMTQTGSQANYYHPGSKNIYHLDQRQNVNELTAELPSRIIPFALAEISRGGHTNRIINLALDLNKIEVGENLDTEQEMHLNRALSSLNQIHSLELPQRIPIRPASSNTQVSYQ